MIDIQELREWLDRQTLPEHGAATSVAIDDGGLTIVAFNANGEETGGYYEIGGTPDEHSDEDVCSECGAWIPMPPPGMEGGLANKHHEESCSLYDSDQE